jgi:xylulokinase
MSDILILGLDIGTSGCKAVVFNQNWSVVAHSFREYDLISAGNNKLDLEAETVWERLTEAIIEINRIIGAAKVEAIAVSALGDVIIPLDKSGSTVRPCIIDFDPRGKDEIAGFLGDFSTEKLFKITGMPPLHINSLAKILWIKNNEPWIYKKVYRWATFEDYILQKLGVRPSVSYSLAARTMLFDIHNKCWSKDVLAAAGIYESQLAEPLRSGTVIAKIDDEIAKKLGFSGEVTACSGGHDMFCAAVGTGLDVDEPNTALNIVGTMEGIVVLMRKPRLNKEMLSNLYPCFPGFNEFVSLSINMTSGSILKWYRGLLSEITAIEIDSNKNAYDALLEGVDQNAPGGLLLIPHFSGTCNPVFNPDSKGTLHGLSLNTGVNDLIQGIIEGLCYELRMQIQGFKSAGIQIDKLKIVGGGSRSDKWLQIKSNITGLDIVSSSLHEASATGAAALGGCAVGMIDNPYKVSNYQNDKEKEFHPSLKSKEKFDEKFLKYQKLFKSITKFETGFKY